MTSGRAAPDDELLPPAGVQLYGWHVLHVGGREFVGAGSGRAAVVGAATARRLAAELGGEIVTLYRLLAPGSLAWPAPAPMPVPEDTPKR